MCILRHCSHRRSNQETRQTIYQWTVYYLRHNEEKVKIFWNFFGSIKKVCSSTDDFDGNTVQYWIISLGLSNDLSITTHSRVQPNCVCKDCFKQNPSFTNGWTLQRPKRKRKRPKVSIAALSLLKVWIYTGNTKHVRPGSNHVKCAIYVGFSSSTLHVERIKFSSLYYVWCTSGGTTGMHNDVGSYEKDF